MRIKGFTEARVNGKWQCIDFYQHDAERILRHIPCITGGSFTRLALERDCDMQYQMGIPKGISDGVRRECTRRDGRLYGEEESGWHSWYIIEGSWFDQVDFGIPESCGFFPRQAISHYLSHPDEDTLNTDEMLSAEEYQSLDAEAKKAYQYYEYTDPSGNRAILQNLKQAVEDRVFAFNEYQYLEAESQNISLSDIRVLILER